MDLYIFDFDDTLAITDSVVKVIRGEQEIPMTSREFAVFPFNPQTDSLDFGDFHRAQGTLIKGTVDEMMTAIESGADVFVVTARSLAAPVRQFLEKELGTSPPVVATAGSAGKAPWLQEKLSSGAYDRVVVYEDCRKNIRTLKSVAEKLGVIYSAMCILEDQSIIQAETHWKREDLLLNEDEFRSITRNFLKKSW